MAIIRVRLVRRGWSSRSVSGSPARGGPSSWWTPPSGPGASRGLVLLRQVRAGSLGAPGNRRSGGRVGAGPLLVTGGAVFGVGGGTGGTTVGAGGATVGAGGTTAGAGGTTAGGAAIAAGGAAIAADG